MKTSSVVLAMMVLMLAAGALVLVTGCGENGEDDVVITQADNHQSVRLSVGRKLIVLLPGNPTTGYEWIVAKTDDALLPLKSSTYSPKQDQPGAGGEYRFEFDAVKNGSVSLRLVYKRAWESEPADTFEVSVVIE